MAKTPPAAGRPVRQLVVLALATILLLGLMFFSGTSGMSWTERMEPRLGMDLVGGTRVTLLAATEDGGAPSEDALERAREIIESRVNSLGVEEAEVVSEGSNRIVVSVAGEPENALRSVGDPAELRFRKVIEQAGGTGVSEQTEQPEATPSPGASADPESTATPLPSAEAEPSPEATGEAGGTGGGLQTPEPTGTAESPETPSPEATDEPAEDEAPAGDYGTVEERQQQVQEKIGAEAMQAALTLTNATSAEGLDTEALLEQIRPFGELTGPEVAVLPTKLQFYLPTITCEQLNDRPAGSVQDPDEIVAACDEAGTIKYLLDASKVLGTDVSDADALIPPGTNRWQVSLSFTGSGQPKWTDLTREATQNDLAAPFDPSRLATNLATDEEGGEWSFDTSAEATDQNNLYQPPQGAEGEAPAPEETAIQCGQQTLGSSGNCLVAAVLDNKVVSAPEIQTVITSDAQITGDFGAEEAQLLASQLRFGALPLTFEPQEEQSISATLGVEYLKAGLLAAGIGMSLVLVYVFFYYRLLGIVIFGSLVASSVLIYTALVVLGRGIGYTLTLAGISGFIVAVGIAADSFVIYFERLKDEIRDGRTPRSAVPRAWARARRTIITANAVTLLAALVLYLLSAGQVRGFAFALGLATVLDLFIVFTFRHPLMTLLARTRAFLSPSVSGLGRALALDRAQRGGVSPPRAREVEV